jgi:hypothetical protein
MQLHIRELCTKGSQANHASCPSGKLRHWRFFGVAVAGSPTGVHARRCRSLDTPICEEQMSAPKESIPAVWPFAAIAQSAPEC